MTLIKKRALNENIWGKTLIVGEKDVYYPLIGHLLDTATVAGALWEKWLRKELQDQIVSELGPDAKKYLQLAAGLHDLGKASPMFQGSLLNSRQSRDDAISLLQADGFIFPKIDDVASARTNKFHRHEKLGSYSIDPSKTGLSSTASEKWFNLCIVGHHGSFSIDYGGKRDDQISELEQLISQRWKDEQQLLIESVENAVGATVLSALDSRASNASIILISGLIILSDRIASSSKSVENAYSLLQDGTLSIHNPTEWLQKRNNFLEAVAQEQVGFPEQLSYEDVLGGYDPRGVQKLVPEKDGLWICMAPTGAGKTEAALLRHSLKNERLIFLLPTLSTTNAMMGRLEKTYSTKKTTTAVLGHGLAYLEDFYNSRNGASTVNVEDCGLVPTEFSNVRGAKLSATVNIATIDQMLMGSFRVKWTHLRWLLLANSHIVIDEAHLLDHYQIELLKPLLTFLGKTKSRVTILSATLPNWLESVFVSSYSHRSVEESELTVFPSSTLVNTETGTDNFEKNVNESIETLEYKAKISIEKAEDSIGKHISWAQEILDENPKARLGIFVNQVKRAQDIALQLQESMPGVTVICLHSRMFAKHRKQVTDRLLKLLNTNSGSAERIILVGTQVIEMSLDIDLDLISTDICPAPSLIQRMGRSWRNKDSEDRFDRISKDEYPEMHVQIVVPYNSEKDEIDKFAVMPYALSLINRTLEYLSSRSEVNFPKDLQNFVETVYLDPANAKSKDDTNEIADYFYKSMNGSQKAIKADFLYKDKTRFKDIGGILTDSDSKYEEMATRLIEIQSVPFIIKSNNKELLKLGAIPLQKKLDDLNFREAQSGSVSLSMKMDKALEDDPTLEKLKLDKFSLGYFGELPNNFFYDTLVGLIQK